MVKSVEIRAVTVVQKKMMMEAILNSWLKCPDLRLGEPPLPKGRGFSV